MMTKRAKIKKMLDSDDQSTQSGGLIGSNDDLLTEILRRLPVVSVTRFKCVSKHWLSLLSHRHFTLLYKNHRLISNGLFIRNFYVSFDVKNQSLPPFHSLDFYPDRRGIRIVQSCNGLLLCCSDRGSEYKRKYYVFNPITKQFAVIPSVIGGPDASRTIRFMCMAFHPLDFVHYKIVCFRKAEPRQNLVQIQIYSSETGKWKISNQSFSSTYYISFGSGVYWNGAIHWAPTSLDPLYFKLDVERLQRLPLPKRVASSRGYDYIAMPLYFGESRGHLHLVERAHHNSNSRLNVYELLSDHSGWVLKYQVDLDELQVIYPLLVNQNQLNYEFEVLDVVRSEEEEDAFMVLKIPQKIIRYDILQKSFKEIFDLPNVLHNRRIGHEYVHRFTESLSSF